MTSMWHPISVRDEVSNSRDDVIEELSAPNAAPAGVQSGQQFKPDKFHPKIGWSFAASGTLIALFFLSWIAYRLHKNAPDGDVLLGVSAAVLAILVCGLSYLTLKYQTSTPDVTNRIAEAEHIGSATKDLGVRIASRLGALYVLEQAGIESRESAGSVLNSLLNFIRSETDIRHTVRVASLGDEREKVLPDDVQAALVILGRLRTLGQVPLSLKIDLSWCDLSWARLRGWDFSGINLHHAILNDADLGNANFDNANLSYCSFKRARIVGASFRWTIMFEADFTGTLMVNCSLSGAMLARAVMRNVEMHNCSLRSSMLQNVQIVSGRLIDVDFREASTNGIQVIESEIVGNGSGLVLPASDSGNRHLPSGSSTEGLEGMA